ATVHVPHLVSLWHPTRVVGAAPVTVEISVDAASDLARVVELIEKTAGTLGGRPRVEVVGLDADGARVRVAVTPRRDGPPSAASVGADRNALYCAVSAALKAEGVALGRGGREGRA